MSMEKQIVIGTSDYFYPKPISLLVQTACRFESRIYIQIDSQTLNVKRLADIVSICLKKGDTITISTSGKDEYAALNVF